VEERNVAAHNTDGEFACLLLSVKDKLPLQYSLWSAAFPAVYNKTVEAMAGEYKSMTTF
jgi:hypothetical protein